MLLVLRNWKSGVLNIGFDFAGSDMDEPNLSEAFAYKQLRASDVIGCHRRVSGSLRADAPYHQLN